MYLAFGLADVGVIGELLAGLWKLASDWSAQPGVWLIAGSLAIVIITALKAPKAPEPSEDKVDPVHPIVQVILRLLGNVPRITASLIAVAAFTVGVLDLTGTVPLREKRADAKVEAKAKAADTPAQSARDGIRWNGSN